MWWNRFGALFANDIRRQRVSRMGDAPLGRAAVLTGG